MKRMKCNYYTLVGLALIALPTWAQQKNQTHAKDSTVNRTVVVEQEYNPDILDASKINVLPRVEEPVVGKKEVEYAITPAPSASIPINQMQAYIGQEVQPKTQPGYVRLGYGSYGNLDLLGNYLFRLSDKDRLNVNFKMDGMNGKLDGESEKWDAFYYRTRANMDYTHQFGKVDLNLSGNFGLSNFNYRPNSINGKQKFTSGSMEVGALSTDETLPVQFNVSTGLLLYQRQKNNSFTTSPQETQIETQANVSGSISDEQRVHVALSMNNIIYKNIDFENYTALGLNPYYELNNDSWLLHLGANVDMSFGYGKSVRVSPDVTAQYIFSDSYILYANATGGKQINDFRRLERLSPYGDFATLVFPNEVSAPVPYSQQLADTYEQLNAVVGFKASPFPGVWFNIYGGYQDIKDIIYNDVTTLAFGQANAHNTYIGIEASYDYKDIVSLSATGKYRNWSSEQSMALLIQPTTEFTLNADVRPISPLTLTMGYQYIGRKKEMDNLEKLSPVSNLYIGATYHLFKGVSVYARINNLLNKDYQYYLGYPTEGINFLGGLSFQF